jgi:P4 family phage/plasmid primase-like protien
MTDTTVGYATAKDIYWDAGWPGILMLAPDTKYPPPTGFTGHDGVDPSYPDMCSWAEQTPGGNLALRLPDTVIGIDVDAYGTKTGAATLTEAQRRWGPLPATYRSTSPDDGLSGIRLYRIPAGVMLAGKIAFDELGIGDIEIVQHHHRYAMAWPSIHPSGRPYRWIAEIDGSVVDYVPAPTDLPDLPDRWITALRIDTSHNSADGETYDVGAAVTDGRPSAKVARRLTEALADIADGASRHDHLLGHVLALLRHGKDGEPGVKLALRTLRDAYVAAVGPDRAGGHAEARSEFNRMVTNPRATKLLAEPSRGAEPPPDEQRRAEHDRQPRSAATAAGDDTSEHGDDHIRAFKFPDGYRPTDVGNANRLLQHAGGRIRYVHAWGKWIVYQRGRWIIDEKDALVTETAKKVAKGLYALAAKTAAKDPDEAKPIWDWALKSDTSGAIAAMIRLARGAPGILVDHEDLDADPWLLNVSNGTIDLRTGRLRDHDPADLCTLKAPVAYDPDATAPLWEACIGRWQPDDAVRDYVQVRAGAGATGIPTETVDVDYVCGGNGKSKFHGAIQHVLGPYAAVPHKSLLVAGRFEQHPTVVADLFRKRLAVASETKQAEDLDDESVKNLTGGDRLKGRRMREDPWEFCPTHTLVMFSNHKPTVQGCDEGIWRRLRLVPWQVTIPEDERDEHLAAKLQAEAAGILRWVVDGAFRFHRESLIPPAAVRTATAAYRAEEDVIGRFIADVLEVAPHTWCYSIDIKNELVDWCAEQGIEDPPRMNEIAATLREMGCNDGGRKHIHGKRSTIWHGVSVTQTGGEST